MKGKQLLCLGLAVFMISAMITMQGMNEKKTIVANAYEKEYSLDFDEEDLGKLCLSGSLLVGSRGNTRRVVEGEVLQELSAGGQENVAEEYITENYVAEDLGIGAEEENNTIVHTNATKDSAITISDTKPLVIIYHTHATESYQPASEGNFHIIQESSSVREVGNVLTQALQEKGIQVVHDKTLHDNPSYNQSYSRSLETINNLLAKYPDAAMVIDLHRDAAAYTGGAGKTVLVNGETVAKYALVVGNGNANAQKLKDFAGNINKTAESMYSGFGGKIIEKAYKFNQYVSDKHILLEIGNNENNIKEANACARYFAEVIAEILM